MVNVLEIAITWFYTALPSFFIWIYLISKGVVQKLLFYPVGIVITIYLVFWLFFCLVSAGRDLHELVKLLYYNLIDLFEIMVFCSFFFKFFFSLFNSIITLLHDVLRVYAVYYFIFFVKRIEIHFFWLGYIFLYY